MNTLRTILSRAWRIFFFLNGSMLFLLLFPVFKLLLSREKWFPAAFRVKQALARILIFTSGLSVKRLGTAKLDAQKAYVFCPNHTSFLDIVVSYLVVPNYFHYIGKAELLKVPFFNIFFKKMNIVVDRSSIRASHRAFQRCCEDIDKRISIAIFPEATIPASTPELGNFKNGAFKLAIEKQIPIVPITFLDNWKILPDGKSKGGYGGPGRSRVFVHDPIPTTGLTENDANELKKQVYQTIHKCLQDHRIIGVKKITEILI